MISVIIPVHNVEDYLHDCINSVLKQTYQDFEIICIDDNSVDSSLEILEYFSKKDSRVKILINDSTQGLGYSMNKGLEVAQGKYISFLDGEDWFSPDAFEIFIKKIEQDNSDLLFFKSIVYYNELHEFGFEEYYDMEFMDKFENQVFNHLDLDKTELFEMPTSPWNNFYRKSFLDDNNIRFPDENLIQEDTPFFYKVITSAKKVSLIDKYPHNSRRRHDSITLPNNEILFDSIDITYKILDVFFEDKELYHYYKKELLTYLFEDVLNSNYFKIDDKYKDEFFIKVQRVYRDFIKEYGLYKDIKENVPEKFLNRFKFEEIVSELLCHNPQVSVIIPVYNAEDYLERTFNSLINQTIGFDNLEIIFVDDASTDKSTTMINNFSNRFWNVKSIFLDENSGSGGKPRNVGINYATADYLMFLDSDDAFMDDACEVLYREITNDGIDVVSGVHSWDGVNPSSGLWSSILADPNDSNQNNEKTINYMLNNKFPLKVDSIDDYCSIIGDFAFTSKIYKKSFLEKNSIYFAEGIIAEDSVFLCNVLLNAKGIKYINKIVYLYYHDRSDGINKSMSYINSKKILMGLLDAFFMMYDLCLNKNKLDIFIHYLLFRKLVYFLKDRLMISDLSIQEVFDLLHYATPLFKSCVEYNGDINSDIGELFKFIASEDYENAIKFIFGEDISDDENFKSIFN